MKRGRGVSNIFDNGAHAVTVHVEREKYGPFPRIFTDTGAHNTPRSLRRDRAKILKIQSWRHAALSHDTTVKLTKTCDKAVWRQDCRVDGLRVFEQ